MLPLETQEKIHNIKKILRYPIDEVWRKTFPPRVRGYARGVAGLLMIAAVLLTRLPGQDANNLKVYFFDIGQGDGSLIKVGDYEVLIDSGPTGKIVQKLGEVMPFYDREIELMILTHPHADHLVGQIDVLRRYKVKKVLYTGVVHTTDEYLEWLKEIKEQKIPMEIVKAGDKFDVAEVTKEPKVSEVVGHLEILYPFDDLNGQRVVGKAQEAGGLNDASIVVRLTYGQASFLFTGDIGVEVEKKLLQQYDSYLRSDILKVGHHGSRFSTSKEFVDAVNPKYAVIQVGKNDYGHPAFRPMWYLEQAGVKILRNDQDGDIIFESDSTNITVTSNK